ncbi:MAG: GGDEF domain-containing phosphodiesterase, partial [Rhodocyclaceae bacterium]|nr:GGDEF domain-containing phosphodiesterase [Rhodocyclaceae bacterium]
AEILEQPYHLKVGGQERTLVVGHTMGVALFPRDGTDSAQLLRAAELALYTARQRGGAKYRFFQPEMQSAVEYRRRLEDDLRNAIIEEALQLAFQPIVNLQDGQVAGAEALVRWQHPERGFVSPDIFIPLSEELGLIGAIGRFVLDRGCRFLKQWRDETQAEVYLSINVSARQIPDEMKPEEVIATLQSHQLPASSLAIEITEGALMSHVAVAQEWIGALRSVGIRIYLDDFGTGYSSLSYLKRFRIDTVKIDKTFIRDLPDDPNDRALVFAIVTMAGSLGLSVIAEGVENERQLAELRAMGCRLGQGYFFSRPLPPDEFMAYAQGAKR